MFRTSYRDFPTPSEAPTPGANGYTNGYNSYIPPEKMDSPATQVPPDFAGFRSPPQEPDSETSSSPMLTPATTSGTQEELSEPKRSPSSEDLAGPDLIREMLTSLSVRGTGRYTCPYLHDCRKGGVKYGELVVFERNSAFRLVSGWLVVANRPGPIYRSMRSSTCARCPGAPPRGGSRESTSCGGTRPWCLTERQRALRDDSEAFHWPEFCYRALKS